MLSIAQRKNLPPLDVFAVRVSKGRFEFSPMSIRWIGRFPVRRRYCWKAPKPKWANDWLFDYFGQQAELERYRLAVVNQHQPRTDNVEDLVERYYWNHQAVLEVKPLSQRSGALRQQLKNAKSRKDIDQCQAWSW